MLIGIKNFLQFIYENWTTIFMIVVLVASIIVKVRATIIKIKNGEINIAKEQVHQIILKLVTDAETDYSEWTKAGSIKRAQVINQIYENYPIFEKVIDQKAFTKWVDTEINDALKTLTEIVIKNKE